MRLRHRLPLLIILWLAAEFAAFGLVARAVGFSGALILCFLTSLGGFAMLRRLGLSTAWRLRRAMAERSNAAAGLSRGAVVDGALVALGSFLLILPGFVSDFIGLALAAPSIRARVSERLQAGGPRQQGGRRGAPEVIELEPDQWSRADDAGAPASRIAPQKLQS